MQDIKFWQSESRIKPSRIEFTYSSAIRSIPPASIRAEDIRQRQQNVWGSVTKHTRYGSSSFSESLIEILQSESSRPGRQELIEEVAELAEETSDGRICWSELRHVLTVST